MAAKMFGDPRRFEMVQKLARFGQRPFARNGYVSHVPGLLGGWTAMRDLKAVPEQSFRDWWRTNR
jgi:L-lactate dehydrogenase complex protein LldF